MADYTGIDAKSLTVEDALADEQFGKTPWDYFEFVGIDSDLLESINEDFTIEEAGEFLKAIALYCCTGKLPNLSQLSTSAVKFAVRNVSRNHDRRMTAEYLRHYRQYVAQKQKSKEPKRDS